MINLKVKKLDARLAQEKRKIIMTEIKKGFSPKEVKQLLRLTTCDYIYQVIRESEIEEIMNQDRIVDYITKDERKFKIKILEQKSQDRDGRILFSIVNKNQKTYFYTLIITEELYDKDGWRLNTEQMQKEASEALQEIGIRKIKLYLERKDFDFSVNNRRKEDILKIEDIHCNYKTYLKKLDEEIVSF